MGTQWFFFFLFDDYADLPVERMIASKNAAYVLAALTSDASYRSAVGKLTDDELAYCLQNETRKTGISLLEAEQKRRIKAKELEAQITERERKSLMYDHDLAARLLERINNRDRKYTVGPWSGLWISDSLMVADDKDTDHVFEMIACGLRYSSTIQDEYYAIIKIEKPFITFYNRVTIQYLHNDKRKYSVNFSDPIDTRAALDYYLNSEFLKFISAEKKAEFAAHLPKMWEQRTWCGDNPKLGRYQPRKC